MRHAGIYALLATLVSASMPAIAQQDANQPPDHPLVRQVRELLAQGKAADALTLTAEQHQAKPGDATVLAVYTGLRMSIARQAISAQKFADAEKLLQQVADAQPGHKSAPEMLKHIRAARSRVPQALSDAGQLLRIERFEQAAILLAQAAGLTPSDSAKWKEPWLTAAIGAGDDHYLMRNYTAALPF